ncbi:hypothetical protein M5X06_27390 [Paenibacillus alvei]|uniref:Phage protein n=1 Tax=Paenibacillus alvei TaxID=44250 RepID=A0ABT4H6T4_PAEAL|nr:hypothetical protein [Paenibacillus alvei]MCY9764702.1 hypothetical protein [Paenibacillus alvei]MCY9770510.1 hypothetical protein [Paenibacillus alvei]
MRVEAKVVNRFKALEHDEHIYEPGDTYPAEGYEADKERVTFLSEVHPKYKTIFLADIREVKELDKKPNGKAKMVKDEGNTDDKE